MKIRSKQSAHADMADLQNVFSSLPKTTFSELISEIAYYLKQHTTVAVPANIETFESLVDELEAPDSVVSRKIRSITECVLRDQILRQSDILQRCAQAYASNQTRELEVVKISTEARLKQIANAYAAVRALVH